MKKTNQADVDPDVPEEVDFSNGVRGRYAGFALGSRVVVLEPDIAKQFPNSAAVNEALRVLMNSAPAPAKVRRKRAS